MSNKVPISELKVGCVYQWSLWPLARYVLAPVHNRDATTYEVVQIKNKNGEPTLDICPEFKQNNEGKFLELSNTGVDDTYVIPDGGVFNPDKPITYKYNEPALLKDLSVYVDDTYSEHYAQTSFQSTEVIIDSGHGVGFCLGNVLKYANRYGRKDGYNRKDLFKILHYTLIAIFIHDRKEAE